MDSAFAADSKTRESPKARDVNLPFVDACVKEYLRINPVLLLTRVRCILTSVLVFLHVQRKKESNQREASMRVCVPQEINDL